MSAAALVERLGAAGCSLTAEGNAVRVRGPRRVLTPEVLDELRQHKAEVINTLLLGRAGDLAAEVSAHVEGCGTCAAVFFSTDESTPCCRAGAALKARYREARRRALEGEP